MTLEQRWEKMAPPERQYCCRTEKLPLRFIIEHWGEMTGTQKRYCIMFQQLSLEFIERVWTSLSKAQRKQCCRHQQLSVTFIEERWDRMDLQQKRYCLTKQKYIDEFTLGELPELLTSPEPNIRKVAARSVKKRMRRTRSQGVLVHQKARAVR